MKERIDTYDIRLPNDIFDLDDDDAVERYHQLAIDQAREDSEDYVIPCHWESEFIREEGFELVFRVTRRSRKG